MKFHPQLFSIVCCIALTSCATTQRTDLYFGRAIPGGGEVSDAQWRTFCDNVITRYFPEGYTEFTTTGRWKDPQTNTTITEPGKVVSFFGKPGALRNAALDSVTQQYIKRFKQQSVLRADSKTHIKFIEAKP